MIIEEIISEGMDISIWVTIIIVVAIVWSAIIYEILNSPVYPPDYPNRPKEAPDKPTKYKPDGKL
jgi:hypothetical protein|tara:strand:- start:128 stop:322 length:195 start_codon:yes stop_codon:yes gene_type:complete